MNAVQFHRGVRVPNHVLSRELDGESVLLNLDSESYFSLDSVGTRMWAQLTTSPSIEAAFLGLSVEYDVEAERLRGDLAALVSRLLDLGLLELTDG